MGRKIRKLRSRNRFVTFKVSEDFFNKIDNERKRVFEKTGIKLTQPALSNLLIRNSKLNFLKGTDIFNGTKKRTKK